MRLLYDNEIDKRAPADFSGERANFWATNVQIPALVVPWRTLTPTAQFYTLDAGLGNTITANCAAIAGHNLTSGATMKIQAHPTNVWTAPDLDQTIAWNAGVLIVFFTETTKRFWRFYLSDGGNPDGYINIGRLELGSYLQMPPIEPGVKLPRITTSRVSTSISGQVFGDRGIRLLAPAFVLPVVSQEERASLEEMWEEVENIKPVFLVVWEDSLDVQRPVYCRIDQDSLEFVKAAEQDVLWSLDLAFMEVT